MNSTLTHNTASDLVLPPFFTAIRPVSYHKQKNNSFPEITAGNPSVQQRDESIRDWHSLPKGAGTSNDCAGDVGVIEQDGRRVQVLDIVDPWIDIANFLATLQKQVRE